MTNRSCSSCEWADLALTDDGLAIECHLAPPITWPATPTVEGADDAAPDEADMADVTVEVVAHRYPHVLETDWCSKHKDRGPS